MVTGAALTPLQVGEVGGNGSLKRETLKVAEGGEVGVGDVDRLHRGGQLGELGDVVADLATAYLQRLTGTDVPLLTKDPLHGTGLPTLERFAEAKLRPPQPPWGPSPQRSRPPQSTLLPRRWCGLGVPPTTTLGHGGL
jgi:hypothetical protein